MLFAQNKKPFTAHRKDSWYNVGKYNHGSGLVEIVVAVSIVSVSLVALAAAVQISSRVITDSMLKTQALFIAEEGLEAVRALRDGSWSSNIDPLLQDTVYYLSTSTTGGTLNWEATTTDQGLINGAHSHLIVFHDVYRDINDDIVSSTTPGALLDSNTLRVSSLVRPVRKSAEPHYVIAEMGMYITNLFSN